MFATDVFVSDYVNCFKDAMMVASLPLERHFFLIYK